MSETFIPSSHFNTDYFVNRFARAKKNDTLDYMAERQLEKFDDPNIQQAILDAKAKRETQLSSNSRTIDASGWSFG
ncbi:hypothetical protein AB6D11_19180 [Vibrio splendidus]